MSSIIEDMDMCAVSGLPPAHEEEMLDLREKLMEAETQRIAGVKTYSLDEVNQVLLKALNSETE